jgi:serine/threonine-protein kinase
VLKGKFAYMSPEQARAQPLDCRSDVFALGILLFEALTAERLYSFESPADALVQIINAPTPDAHRTRPDVPEELAAIASRCLAKEREARYPTADAVRDALRLAIQKIGKPADEHRLAEVLRPLFRREEEALRKRIAAVEAAGVVAEDATERSSKPPASLAAASGERRLLEAAPAAALSTPPPARSLGPLVLALLGIALVAVPIAYLVRERASTATAPASTASPLPSLTASSPATAPASASPPAPLSASAPVPPAPPSSAPAARPAQRSRASAHPTAAPSVSPAPPTPSSHKGVLYKDL